MTCRFLSPDSPGAGPVLQGGVRPGDRAPALPVQRAAAGGQQRPLHRVQAQAAERPAALEEDRAAAHPRRPQEERWAARALAGFVSFRLGVGAVKSTPVWHCRPATFSTNQNGRFEPPLKPD